MMRTAGELADWLGIQLEGDAAVEVQITPMVIVFIFGQQSREMREDVFLQARKSLGH